LKRDHLLGGLESCLQTSAVNSRGIIEARRNVRGDGELRSTSAVNSRGIIEATFVVRQRCRTSRDIRGEQPRHH